MFRRCETLIAKCQTDTETCAEAQSFCNDAMLGPYVPNPVGRERATLSHTHTRHTHEHVAGPTRVALGTNSWQDRV